MGGASATNTSVLNKSLTNAVLSVSKACAAAAKNELDIGAKNVSGSVNIGGNITQTAKAEVLDCKQDSQIKGALKSAMAANTNSSALTTPNNLFTGDMGLFSASVTNTNITNSSIMNMDTKDLQKCRSDANNKQKILFGDVGGDFNFTSTVNQNALAEISKCVQSSGVAQELSDTITAKSTSAAKKEGTVNALFDGANGLKSMFIILAVISGVIAIIVALIKASGKKSNTNVQFEDQQAGQEGVLPADAQFIYY